MSTQSSRAGAKLAAILVIGLILGGATGFFFGDANSYPRGFFIGGSSGKKAGHGQGHKAGSDTGKAAVPPPAPPPAARPALEKVRIGYPSVMAITFVLVDLAKDKGFFEKEGLDIETPIIGGPQLTQAVVAGDIHFSLALGSGIIGILRGAPVRVVSGIFVGPNIILIGHRDIKSVSQLKGKTVGYTGGVFGVPHRLGMTIMERNGFDLKKDVSFLSLRDFPDLVAALEGGQIQGAMIAPPSNFILEGRGHKQLADSGDYLPGFVQGGVVTSLKLVREKPEVVQKFVNAVYAAQRYAKSERAASIAFLQKNFKINQDTATKLYDSTSKYWGINPSDEGLMIEVRWDAETAQIKDIPPLSQIIDRAFIERAIKGP